VHQFCYCVRAQKLYQPANCEPNSQGFGVPHQVLPEQNVHTSED